MLDRAKLSQELKRVAGALFADSSDDILKAKEAWHLIAHDENLSSRIATIDAPFSIPSWHNAIGQKKEVSQTIQNYHILSVDGSQIYPDRHQGPSCFLINIGSIVFHYDTQSRVHIYSQPSIFSAHNNSHNNGQDELLSTDNVNCRRQELEFNQGLKQAIALKQIVSASHNPFLLLFDGSLIFWLLESKDNALQADFLPKYLAALDQMHKEQIPVAGYISLPKSRELVNIIRLALANFNPKQTSEHTLCHLVDSTIASFFLAPYERTILFQNNATISKQYPGHLRPYFFYINVGTEIGRVEIPQWIAHNEQLTDQIASIIIDQCKKGYGYPIAIAQAHEAAVVKGPDRDFFYYLLDKMSIEKNQPAIISQKSRHKKHISL